MTEKFSPGFKFVKVDEKLGLVLGFAIICKKNGKEYFDVQGDHIPEDSMLKAATDFMIHSRMAGEMHDRDENNEVDEAGQVVFAFPLTTEIAKAFNIETPRTGLMIAMKPNDEAMLEKFRNGDFTGFSIGGDRLEDEDVD